MKTKHTPGPWKINQTTLYRGEEMISDESGQFIAGISNRDESEANAKLIAAAPEMLDALKAVYDLIDSGVLVRDTSFVSVHGIKDDDFAYFTKQSVKINNAVVLMNKAIEKATS